MTTRGIVGAVLVGGSSRRMGADKSMALVGGVALRDRAFGVLEDCFAEVVLSAAETEAAPGGRRVVVDRFRGLGPLAALDAVLAATDGNEVFVLACDLPLVSREAVARIVAAAGDGPRATVGARAWLASGRGEVQPLCGLYNRACAEVVGRHLETDRLSMRELLTALEVRPVAIDDLGEELLLNVNDPAALERARRLVDG